MRLIMASLAALTLASVAAPSLAQGYPYGGYGNGYGSNGGYGNGSGRGDYYGGNGGWYGRRFDGYPEFRGAESHIRQEIWQYVREDMIERSDAQDLLAQLQRIRQHEQREFRVHGWNLPEYDRQAIRSELDQLDREVDRIRDEQ